MTSGFASRAIARPSFPSPASNISKLGYFERKALSIFLLTGSSSTRRILMLGVSIISCRAPVEELPGAAAGQQSGSEGRFRVSLERDLPRSAEVLPLPECLHVCWQNPSVFRDVSGFYLQILVPEGSDYASLRFPQGLSGPCLLCLCSIPSWSSLCSHKDVHRYNPQS